MNFEYILDLCYLSQSDMSRLLVLQAEMDGPVNLLDSHRELLKQGSVTLHRAKDDKLVDRTAFLVSGDIVGFLTVFLFDYCFVFAQKCAVLMLCSQFSDLLLICQDTLLGLKAKYKVKHIVHLATAKVRTTLT